MTALALAGVPREGTANAEPVLQVARLVKEFRVKSGSFRGRDRVLRAIDDVSFDLGRGETLGIVGESGSGKTTLARVLMGLEPTTSGTIRLFGKQVDFRSKEELRRTRRSMQIVFQDPYSSLDPQMSVFQVVSEPWIIHPTVGRKDRRARASELLSRVGLDPAVLDSKPSSLSGGQRQRVGIARALALSPEILILDEPVASLDVSIQAQVVELLRDLQDQLGLSMIFVAHDLAVVRSLAHRIAVMYLGRIVEAGNADRVYDRPSHPYTRALLSSVPAFPSERRPERIKLTGEIPSPIEPPSGCHFRTRCWKAQDACGLERPPLVGEGPTHQAACYFPESPP